MGQSLTRVQVHIVFSTKARRLWLDDERADRVYRYMNGIVEHHRCHLMRAGGMPDHMHLLVALHADVGVSEIVRLIKANSFKWIHETWRDLREFTWQSGYGAFSVSWSAVPAVVDYIDRQKENHAKRTFDQEIVQMLESHRLEHDSKYLFE